ncbi:HTH-type transcriptional regulator CymR [Anaerolineae bacterium]|nr:HTH-type transcriptional regulator CymR [Anaerolineae bacterium]
MLTRKSKYALQALTALARHYGKGPALISTLSKQERIPHKFLELILLELKNLGFLSSKKGRGGGYMLGRAPELIFIGEVVRCMEGPIAPLPCASETEYRACDECPEPETCGLRMVMKEVADKMAAVLDRTSLADLVSKSEKAASEKATGFTYQI